MASSNNSSPLNISIVGAGIGGLTAAIALRRNGHNVQIFEAAEIKTEIGAAVAAQTNSLKVLDRLGVSRENLKGVPWQGSVVFPSDGSEEGTTSSWLIPGMKENGLLCHRSDLYEELKRLATGEGEGPPAKLCLGTRVVSSDPEEGTVTLDGGEIVHGDCILGADGIHSVVRSHILGKTLNARNSGWSCFRVIFEVSDLLNMPELEWLHAGIIGSRIVIDRDGPFRMFLIYPFRNGTLLNVVAFYPDSPGDEAGWTPTATREEFIAKFPKFHSKFLHFLDLPIHGSIHRWRLRVLPHLPTWVRGRAALLGDAAHGTLPLLGQGAGMAIEDGGSLGCLLPARTRREDIPARLAAYQRLRTERGEFVNTESVAQLSKGFNLVQAKEIQSYLFEYDAMKAAEECYRDQFGASGVSRL
ncbi:FAD/NAD(P)-binding domain-containing protein [Mycena olivaceomarginata]|nr:FAD/NAD(P)-binding domain-containing protein [Mycena olivaceomarginata]